MPVIEEKSQDVINTDLDTNSSYNAISSEIQASTTKEYIISRIKHYSEYYGVSFDVMKEIVSKESSFNPNAIGDSGDSFGCVQIHLPSWKDITKEQAQDIEFSLDFLARKLKDGKCHLWTTCPV